jgi:hypothetical protein
MPPSLALTLDAPESNGLEHAGRRTLAPRVLIFREDDANRKLKLRVVVDAPSERLLPINAYRTADRLEDRRSNRDADIWLLT